MSQRHHPNRRAAGVGLMTFALAPGLWAQQGAGDFPNKPVRIIVPSVPGGLLDTCARSMATHLTTYWKQPVIVENRPGAGMAIGSAMVAKGPADGYTLLVGHEGSIITTPMLVENTPYAAKDFIPLAQIWDTPTILLVNKDLPAQNFAELDAYVKSNPGKLNWPVNDTYSELQSDIVKTAAGWNVPTITYKGNAERLRSLMGGETQLGTLTSPEALPALEGGRVRAIAISTPTRHPKLPNLPTLDESGLKGFSLMVWGGLFAPAGTPEPIAAKLSRDARRALAERDVVERLEVGGNQVPHHVTREQFQQRINADTVRWKAIAAAKGLRIFER